MAALSGFNWFLIIVCIVVALLMVVVAVYTLLHYQHPEDRNQAWWPKIVVVFSIWLSVCTVLFFPIDVTNRKSCSHEIPIDLCQFAIPATEIWYILVITNVVVTWFVIPFTMFYYEADRDYSIFRRIISGVVWVLGMLVVMGLLLGLMYYYIGFVTYDVIGLASGVVAFEETVDLRQCIPPSSNGTVVNLCDGTEVGTETTELYKGRVAFPVYLICINTIVGWLLFMLYGGVGLASFPVDLLRQFAGRPRKVITKSEYIRQAKQLGVRANQIKELAMALRAEERSGGGRGRAFKNNVKDLNRQLVQLEEDEETLIQSFPQGDDPDVTWTFLVIGYWFKLLFGILGLVGSLLWILQTVLYVMINPPVSGFLNDLFIQLSGGAFGQFVAIILFGAFSLYLLLCTMAGSFKLGVTFLWFSIYPMKAGATLMSSMLFNCAVVLVATPAVVSFCAVAFAGLAAGTAVSEIYIAQAQNLVGFRYLFDYNVFVYGLVAVFVLTCVYLLIRGPQYFKKKGRREDAYKN